MGDIFSEDLGRVTFWRKVSENRADQQVSTVNPHDE